MNSPVVAYEKFKISSKRLEIRPLQLPDFKTWVEANELQLPSQGRFDTGKRPSAARNRVAFRRLIRDRKLTWKNDRFYGMGIFEKKSGELVGVINIIPHARTILQSAAIGYVIYNHHWRKGFASESIPAVCLFAFRTLKFHRLTAEVDVTNKASIALSRKVGFKKEARANNLIFDNGKWHDCFIFTMTAENCGVKNPKPVFRVTSVES